MSKKLTKVTITNGDMRPWTATSLMSQFPCFRKTQNAYVFYPETDWLKLEKFLETHDIKFISQDYEE